MATSQAVEDKQIDPDTLKFINSLIADSHQEVYFKGFADIMYTDKKLKPRIVVISNFRIYLIKNAALGRSVRQTFILLHLKSLTSGAKPNQLLLSFDEDSAAKEFGLPLSCAGELVIEHPRIDSIIKSILFSAESIRFGRPKLKIEVPKEWTSDYKGPEPDNQDGLIATYLAECDRCGIPQRMTVLDYLMTCFYNEDSLFDVHSSLAFLDNNECARDILAIASSLKYSKWFTSFVCVDFSLKNEGASALATMFDVPTSFHDLVLVNAKFSSKAMTSLAQSLGLGLQDIYRMNISKNPIGDSGVAALVDGLEKSSKVPIALSLASADLGVKGFKSLAKLLNLKDWSQNLQVLDISDNSMGKSGTEALNACLGNPELRLQQLFLCRSEVDLEKLFSTLKQNPNLLNKTLNLLDVTGNKMTKKALAELVSILSNAQNLSSISLSDCHLDVKFVLEILDSVLSNKFDVKFSLDLSKNELGPRGARDLHSMIAERIAKDPDPIMQKGTLQSLDVSENGLGNDGIVLICKAFQGTTIKSLKLDRNFRTSMFAKATESSDALATFIGNTSSLTDFSITGDDNNFYLSKYLYPMLAAVANHENLINLDVSGNRIGDEGVQVLSTSLEHNSCLRGFNIEGSRMTVTGLSILHRALKLNRTVTDFIMPASDLERIIKEKPNDRSVLKAVFHDIAQIMDRNEQMYAYNQMLQEDDATSTPAVNPNAASAEESESNEATDEVRNVTPLPSSPNRVAADRRSSLSRNDSSLSRPWIPLPVTPKNVPNAASNSAGGAVGGGGGGSSGGPQQPQQPKGARGKRLSVAAGSYENMIASLKDGKTYRKMQTRALDSNIMMLDAMPDGGQSRREERKSMSTMSTDELSAALPSRGPEGDITKQPIRE